MPRFTQQVPDGDNRLRDVCDTCGFIAYSNPKVVIGTVVAHAGQVLLCRRAIEPRLGFWTLPAGFLEHGETLEEGAAREAEEEAGAAILIEGILAVYSISRIGQVQVMFRGRFDGAPRFVPGAESLDVRLFAWEAIPWDELAFPSVHWALQAWRDLADGPLGAPATNPASDKRGTSRSMQQVTS